MIVWLTLVSLWLGLTGFAGLIVLVCRRGVYETDWQRQADALARCSRRAGQRPAVGSHPTARPARRT